jgi:hypothetical protein
MADHMHQDLRHYHLLVRYDGYDFEISEVFRHSNRVRNIPAATVAEIKRSIRDRLEDKIKDNPFYLTWKGRKLEPDTLKLRDIGEGLPMHVPNAKNPIEVHLGNGDDVPSVVLDVASASDDENPDYNNAGRETQEYEKKQQEYEKNKKREMERRMEIDRQKTEAYYAEQRAKNLEKRRQKEAAAAAAARKGGRRRSKRRSKKRRNSRTIKYI